MKLWQELEIRPGVTAIIGGGGKTTLLFHLAEELEGSVLCCTTTKIWPPDHLPVLLDPTEEQIKTALKAHHAVCVGTATGEGKLTAPGLSVAQMASLADHVLVEADGSKGCPLKAHAPHEPVVPSEASQTVLVLGLSGIGRPISQAAHRPALYAGLAGVEETALVTPAIAAGVIKKEGLHTMVFCNQAEGREDLAEQLARLLDCPVVCGSLKERWWRKIR